MNDKSRPEAAPVNSAGGREVQNQDTTEQRISHRRNWRDAFYAAQAKQTAAREAARDRARAEGRPIRSAEVDEALRGIDDGCALPTGEAVGDE